MACIICHAARGLHSWAVSAPGVSLRLTPELCDPCGQAFVLGVAHVLMQLKAAALIRALEAVPEHAELGDIALVVALVVRRHTWDSAVPVLELAVRALRLLDIGEALRGDAARKG